MLIIGKNDNIIVSMPKALKKYVIIDKSVMGGEPVIKGTRIPVMRLYRLVRDGYSPQELQEDYPWVDKEKIQMTVAYLMKMGIDAIEKNCSSQASTR